MKLFVPLEHEEFARLAQIAEAERRRPQEQAALFVVRGLSEASAAQPAAAEAVRHDDR